MQSCQNSKQRGHRSKKYVWIKNVKNPSKKTQIKTTRLKIILHKTET